MAKAIRISGGDNVATLLDACASGEEVIVQGDARVFRLAAVETIAEGHKVALVGIPGGGPVIKFGTVIGTARRPITPGSWVHLHNLASGYDERSQTLDTHSGAATDTVYR
jgi:altronate dehydratase small subunit